MKKEEWTSWHKAFRQQNQDLHVMPNNDKHECSSKCYCGPEKSYTDEVTKRSVWLHKSYEELSQ